MASAEIQHGLLSPPELGLPEQFDSWRANQEDAIHRIITSEKRFVVICAPTGFGKSLVTVAAGVVSGRRSGILTSTKGLQDQLHNDFDPLLADIRGLANYICPIAVDLGVPPTTNVADAPCQGGYKCSLRFNGGCTYYDNYRAAQQADEFATNYQCFLYDGIKDAANTSTGTLQRPSGVNARAMGMLILDEAHDSNSELSRFLGAELTRRECLSNHVTWPDSGMTIDGWRSWALTHLGPLDVRIKSLEKSLREPSLTGLVKVGGKASWSRELKHLRDLQRKILKITSMYAEDEWIAAEQEEESSEYGYHRQRQRQYSRPSRSQTTPTTSPLPARSMISVRFDPLSPARYAESALFRGIPKVVLVSATVRPKTAALLGIPSAEMEFVEYESSFPLAQRPVIAVRSVQMNYLNEQDDDKMRWWLAKLDLILGARLNLGWKGIIHAVSFKRAKFIIDNSEHSHSMVVHGKSDRDQKVAAFRAYDGAQVLVSPSVDTGYDFAGDAARFQIIAKLPFTSMQDPVEKARQERDKDYTLYQVAQTLVQMTGRIVRSESDWGETIILDDSIRWSLPRMRMKGFLPKWWLEAFRFEDLPPKPMRMAEA